MSSSVLKVKQGQCMPLFLDFCLMKNDVKVQIASYIGKELLAKRPTIVTVAVVALAPWAWKQHLEAFQPLKKLNKANFISMPQFCSLLSDDNPLNLCMGNWQSVK
jgi:hypothetical protein